MTRQEFQALTDIGSQDEAKEYISRAKMLFITSIVIGVAWQFVDEAAVMTEKYLWVLALGSIAFQLFFIGYCWKIIQLTKKVTKASIIWLILFAPISWFWFYPALVQPLHIIAGDQPAPDHLETAADKKEFNKKVNSNTFRSIGYIVLAVLAGAIIYSFFQ